MDKKTAQNVIETMLKHYNTKGLTLLRVKIEKDRYGIAINFPYRETPQIGSLAQYHEICASEDPKKIAAVLEAIQNCEW